MNESGFVDLAADLLTHYSFDLAGQTVGPLVAAWMQRYPSTWLRAAVVEALYQGRYKAISVEKILTIWSRRQRPICHFNLEFERMVCAPVTSDREEVQPIADELNHQESCSPSPLSPEECMSHHFEKAEQFVHSPFAWAGDRTSFSHSNAVEPSGWEHPFRGEPGATSEEPDMHHASGNGAVHPPKHVSENLSENAPEDEETQPPMMHGGDPQPIHKFVPQVPRSPLHYRLQAMVSTNRVLSKMTQDNGASDDTPDPSSEFESPEFESPEFESPEFESENRPAFDPELEHTRLSPVQLAPQPDLEAIADALEQEGFSESPDILFEVDYPLDTDQDR